MDGVWVWAKGTDHWGKGNAKVSLQTKQDWV